MKKILVLAVVAAVAVLVACATADRRSWIGSNVGATVDSSAERPPR